MVAEGMINANKPLLGRSGADTDLGYEQRLMQP